MSDGRERRDRLVALAPVALVLAYHASVFLSVSLSRMSFPFEVEFMEGLTVDYARTVATGRNLYGAASASFAPLYYPPLYYLAVIPALAIGGWSLMAARLVSWLSILLCLLGVCVRLRRLGASPAAWLLSAAVALAYYPDTLYWYDLARVDSLQTLLQVAGLMVLAENGLKPSRRSLVTGAALLAGAVFTKQTAVASCASAILWFALGRDFPRVRVLASSLILLGLLGVAALLAFSGWACVVVFAMPLRHAFSLSQGLDAMTPVAGSMGALAGLGLLGAVVGGSAARPLRFFLLHFAAALVMGFLTMCKHGGQTNSLLPAIVLLGACAGLGYDALLLRWRGASRFARPALGLALAVLLYVPFRGNYLAWLPDAGDRADAAAIWQDMRSAHGPFLAYNHSFVSTILRGEMYPSWHALWDWAGGEDAGASGPDPGRYPPELLDKLRRRTFAVVYTNGSDYFGDPVYRLIKENYRVVRTWPPRLRGGHMERWMYCLPRVKWEPSSDP